MTSAYDLAGRRTRLTWPDTFYVSSDYLVTGETTALRENGASSGLGVLATYGYDDLGRRTSLTLGNGTVTSYTPDAVSRLSSLGLNLSGTIGDLTLGFSYNPASQIASATRSNDSYAWTGAANRNDASSVNGLNQVTNVASASIGYDVRGNLNSNGSSSYTYSSENLLLTGPSSAALIYDPLLRLYQESGTSVATTRFQYDGQAIVTEYNSSGTLQRRYVDGPGSDEPLVEYNASGTRAWLHADERGSVIARSDDTGAKTGINAYDEYGVPASGNVGRFGYTGQAWLPSLSLWYYKARMYAPSLGRFMQTDPIGYGAGMNWYGYVGGDPINWTDPTGLAGVKCNDGTEFTEAQVRTDGADALCANHEGLSDVLIVTGGSGGGGGAGTIFFGPAAGFPSPINKTDPKKTCVGRAYVLKGNEDFLKTPTKGAFGVLITPHSIAVVPRQWSRTARWDTSYKSFRQSTSGIAFAPGGLSQTFSSITDVVNNKDLASNSVDAQNVIMGRAPGQLILEITGGKDLGKNVGVVVFTENPKGCPDGTASFLGN